MPDPSSYPALDQLYFELSRLLPSARELHRENDQLRSRLARAQQGETQQAERRLRDRLGPSEITISGEKAVLRILSDSIRRDFEYRLPARMILETLTSTTAGTPEFEEVVSKWSSR